MNAPDPIAIVEAAYQTRPDTKAWLETLLSRSAPLLRRGLGNSILIYKIDGEQMTPVEHAHIGPNSAAIGAAIAGTVDVGRAIWDPVLFKSHLFETARESFGDAMIDDTFSRHGLADFGFRDVLGLSAFDPSGYILHLVTPLPQKDFKPTEQERRLWMRLGVHILAGWRLHHAVLTGDAQGLDDAAAILTPEGSLLNGDDEATENETRDALRVAVQSIDRARSALRQRDPEASLKLWRGLVEGRWSLVDHFDTDGRRFIVARRNDLEVTPARQLTRRECQVIAHVASGHANKLIAYELGLAESTIATYLQRAMQKLGLTSRAALIQIWGSELAQSVLNAARDSE